MINGIVADIQRASVHDGPGIRTTIFLKGCPLHCAWCHNPECIDFEPQTMYYPEKCIGCGLCNEGCFSGAKVICGREMTVEEVVKQVLLDKDYYGTDGGVTFSGGEPLAQREFLSALIDACKEQGIHCAVETSLIYFNEEIFRKIDLVMADLKIWDDKLHKKYTGVSNGAIKEHFRKLNEMNIPVIARTPVIPEISQGIEQISEFLKKLSNVRKYELLPYHPLGSAKREALGIEPDGFTIPSAEYMKGLEKYVFIRE
ncbi:MAG: radical SAM protein [Tyzzerella sp.]|nr:radical SAM protein [Tyzzerella sp.]